MEQDLIRLLRADEIECRVSVINEKGLSLLLYKDARVDQRILDETFGAFGWKRGHQCIDGNLYCTVEVLNRESGEWISKQDVGTTGFTEKEKSQASDSFKRACFNWGIGRELYSAPFIWIPAGKAGLQKKGDKYVSSERFAVRWISFNDNREIVSLEIVDSKGQVVYTLQQNDNTHQEADRRRTEHRGAGNSKTGRSKENSMKELSQTGRRKAGLPDGQTGASGDNAESSGGKENAVSRTQELVFMAELNRTGVTLGEVLDRYGIESLSQMSPEIYSKAINALKQTKPKVRTPETAA